MDLIQTGMNYDKVKDWSDKEKFVVVLMDGLNYATKITTVASHVLVFLVRSIVNLFKFSFANFATDGISSSAFMENRFYA